MVERTRWIDRRFNFDFPVGWFPCIIERLRGTPARLEEIINALPPEILTKVPIFLRLLSYAEYLLKRSDAPHRLQYPISEKRMHTLDYGRFSDLAGGSFLERELRNVGRHQHQFEDRLSASIPRLGTVRTTLPFEE